MTILGISAFYHDSAAAIIQDGQIVAAAQEERFTRKKNDASFPVNAASFCLQYANVSINDVDAVVFYDKPLLKFERLLETYYAFAPKGVSSFVTAMPVWLKEKLFLKKVIIDSLNEIEKVDTKKIKLLFPEHHLSHAASAFYPSPYEKAAIITVDGVGEWATASICIGEGNKITILKQLEFPHSVGLLYSAFTYFCGFKVNSGEYKLMGLAPYGNHRSEEVQKKVDIIKSKLVAVNDDGSVFLNQEYFSYATGLRMVNDNKWRKLFGIPKREAESHLTQPYCDMALAVQQVTEEIIIKMGRETKKITGADYLCMAGGVALNCVANGKLDKEGLFREIFIQPAAGDAGGALGAALAAHYIHFGNERKIDVSQPDALMGSYLGPAFTNDDTRRFSNKYKAPYNFYPDEEVLVETVAGFIADGKVVGWHQGRMEFGPRALGARSILADARNPEMQKKLNLKIKHREGFRPFAPAILFEDVEEYFEQAEKSPYMLMVKPVVTGRQVPYPENFDSKDLLEKLYFLRSDIPAVTHVDYSARIQTVHKETNLRFWKLLHAFKKLTGYSLVINTSFNVRNEPLVNTPEEAYRCFMRTDMDYLVVGNYIFDKQNQPVAERNEKWKEEFEMD